MNSSGMNGEMASRKAAVPVCGKLGGMAKAYPFGSYLRTNEPNESNFRVNLLIKSQLQIIS